MFRHCVACIDFSTGWDQVHGRLRQLAELLGIRELTLVHVDEPHVWKHRDFVDAAGRVRLDQVVTDLRAALGLEVRAQLASGLPGKALLDAAVQSRADLLVVANLRHMRGDEYLLGNVAVSLARSSTMPLLLVPAEPGMVEAQAPLLLVSDGSLAAGKARGCFSGLLDGRKGRVLQLGGAERQTSLAEAQALDALVSGNPDIEQARLGGDPAGEIGRMANEFGAALIVVGKRAAAEHGEPALEDWMEDLCRDTPSPLLLVPG